MKTVVKISFIMILCNACNSSKNTYNEYFELAYQRLDNIVQNLEVGNKLELKKLEHKTQKYNTNDSVDLFLKKAYQNFKSVQYHIQDIHLLMKPLNNALEKNEAYQYYPALSLLEDKISTNFTNYLDSLVQHYPELMSEEMKVWQRQGKDFLKIQLQDLPLYGGLLRLLQIQYELLKQNLKITEKFIQETEKTEAPLYFHLHLSEEKNKIKLGEDYKASFKILRDMKLKKATMKINGQEIPIEHGIGKMNIQAKGLGKKMYQGEVGFKTWYGRDTVFTIEESVYEVIPRQ